MAFDPKVRAFVRRYYVFDRLTLEQAAQKANVSFNTARRWKADAKANGDDWDKVRDATIMAGGEADELSQSLLTGFLIEYRSTMTALKDDSELSSKEKVALLSCLADSFTKMTVASKRLLPEVSELAVALKTVELLGEYLQKSHPKLLGDFLEVLTGFGEVLDKQFK